jgi:hypothetical protein
MSNGQNGKKYKIWNTINNEKNVGSTAQPLCKRMAKHTDSYKYDKRPPSSLYQHIDKIGLENFFIELIEEFPCETIEQLRNKEGEWIRNMATLNKRICGRTPKERYADNHDELLQKKEYWQNNKDKLNERRPQYYQENKDKISEERKLKYEKQRGNYRKAKSLSSS